jgi:hypothetical protein
VYQSYFLDLIGTIRVPWEQAAVQQSGVDRIVNLPNKTLYVEEKIRLKHYNDVWLEYTSNDQSNSLGWVERDLNIDYLLYAFLESKTAYFFDWRKLKKAWNANKERWIELYKAPPAKNKGYSSLGCAIPIGVLQKAMAQQSKIKIK